MAPPTFKSVFCASSLLLATVNARHIDLSRQPLARRADLNRRHDTITETVTVTDNICTTTDTSSLFSSAIATDDISSAIYSSIYNSLLSSFSSAGGFLTTDGVSLAPEPTDTYEFTGTGYAPSETLAVSTTAPVQTGTSILTEGPVETGSVTYLPSGAPSSFSFTDIVLTETSTGLPPSSTTSPGAPKVLPSYNTPAGKYNYLGCYIDSLGNGFPLGPGPTLIPVTTVPQCLNFCATGAAGAPYKYANIVENQCYCSKTLYPVPQGGTCDEPCSGDPSTICGGSPPAFPRGKRALGSNGVVYELTPDSTESSTAVVSDSVTSAFASETNIPSGLPTSIEASVTEPATSSVPFTTDGSDLTAIPTDTATYSAPNYESSTSSVPSESSLVLPTASIEPEPTGAPSSVIASETVATSDVVLPSATESEPVLATSTSEPVSSTVPDISSASVPFTTDGYSQTLLPSDTFATSLPIFTTNTAEPASSTSESSTPPIAPTETDIASSTIETTSAITSDSVEPTSALDESSTVTSTSQAASTTTSVDDFTTTNDDFLSSTTSSTSQAASSTTSADDFTTTNDDFLSSTTSSTSQAASSTTSVDDFTTTNDDFLSSTTSSVAPSTTSSESEVSTTFDDFSSSTTTTSSHPTTTSSSNEVSTTFDDFTTTDFEPTSTSSSSSSASSTSSSSSSESTTSSSSSSSTTSSSSSASSSSSSSSSASSSSSSTTTTSSSSSSITTTSSATTTTSSTTKTSSATTTSSCPAKPTIKNGGFESNPFGQYWSVGFQNQMMQPVRRRADVVNVPAYGDWVVQQKVDDGENAMYHQTISVCPGTRYKLTGFGIMKTPDPRNPKPYCQLYLCADSPNRCGRSTVLNSNALRRASYEFSTRRNQSSLDVQVYLYCPGTVQGRTNTIYTDEIKIVKA